jgi:hypothetical protein
VVGRTTLGTSSSAGRQPPTRVTLGVLKTVAHAEVLGSLVRRLAALEPETRRRWGTLTAHEMVCHLGDATEMVLRIRPRTRPVPLRSRPIMKWLGLWSPIRWPHGWATNPDQDPRRRGTRPSAFLADRSRAVAALEQLAAPRAALEEAHGFFGRMRVADWQRWAYKHTDHHLRQFGL